MTLTRKSFLQQNLLAACIQRLREVNIYKVVFLIAKYLHKVCRETSSNNWFQIFARFTPNIILVNGLLCAKKSKCSLESMTTINTEKMIYIIPSHIIREFIGRKQTFVKATFRGNGRQGERKKYSLLG